MMKKQFLALVLSALMLAGCAAQNNAQESAQESAEESAGVAVQVAEVESRDISTDDRVSGAVASDDETSVFVSTNAKVLKCDYEAGDSINKGDVICTLDLEATMASYNAASINYNSASQNYKQQQAVFAQQIENLENTIALHEKTLSDTKALFEIGAASQMEIDNLQMQLDNERTQLASLQATRSSTLNQLRASMESSRSSIEQLSGILKDVDGRGNVIAPASGTLATLTAKEGSFVSASMPVAVINDPAKMKILVSVSEALVPKLSVGDEVDVTVAASSAQFTGTIRSLDSTANAQTKLYQVTVSVPADVTGLISGMFADVTFHTAASKNAVVVPSEAIMTGEGGQYVYVVEGGAAKYVAVTTGLNGAGVTEVLTGLKAGEQLVTVGQQYLSDGETVRIVEG